MSARYEVRVYDNLGALQAVVTEWRVLTYTNRVNNVGTYNLEMDGDSPFVDLFDLDGRVEIRRRDQDASPVIDWAVDFAGLHRTESRRITEAGLSVFNSMGGSYTHLLARRGIAFQKASSGADKSGKGETVMKDYVRENAGVGATVPPRLFDGVTPSFTVETDLARGSDWEGERSFRNLLEILREISKATAIDFEVVSTGAASYEFRARPFPIGQDRTVEGLDRVTGLNAAGNAPVVFSLDFGNMQSPEYSLNRMTEATAVLVLGQGIEGDRQVVQRTSAALTASPLNRFESFQDGSQDEATEALEDIGDAALEKLQARETFTFQTVQIPGLLYGRDYFVGDTVTARYRDIQRDKQILGVTIGVQEGREDIDVLLGDVP